MPSRWCTRTAETPASDQYSVPATAAGLSAQLTFGDATDSDSPLTTLGADTRYVDGETREYFFYNAAASDFLRERRAGGTQTVAGLFATHSRPLVPDLTATLGARYDTTWRADGFRRETTRATGAGWQVVGTDNWYGTIPATTVYFPPKLERAAKLLALDLGIDRTAPSVAPMRMDRLTLILTGELS